ncbi:MAG: hypothetical protein ACFFAO_01465 [Candidatus Hermodarchaeota archaeon]
MKKHKITEKDLRNCFICHESVTFSEYKKMHQYLSSFDNPVESFFNILDSKEDYLFNQGLDILRVWKNLKYKVFCPKCLLDYKSAYNYKRNCIKCGREITFRECYCSPLNKGYSKEDLMIYWINPLIQYYCCSCYKKKS